MLVIRWLFDLYSKKEELIPEELNSSAYSCNNSIDKTY